MTLTIKSLQHRMRGFTRYYALIPAQPVRSRVSGEYIAEMQHTKKSMSHCRSFDRMSKSECKLRGRPTT